MTRKSVLVIDDNPMNLELATEVLEAAGFDVLRSSRASDGIETARRLLPDIVLMDIGMPEMDGYEALRRLRADESTRHIPAVAVTAFAMGEDEQRALEAGFDGYIAKPIRTQALAGTVARLVERSGTDR